MPASPGLRLHRASRVEWLVERLADALDATPLTRPLATREVVVAHPGLGSWLQQRLAHRRGADGSPGIVANLRLLLPGEWLLGLAERLLPGEQRAAAAWQREALRWRILQRLPALAEPALQRYLADDAGGRRAFQLADHLAGLYAQYLIYRPEWVAAAESGRERHWQAVLWRSLAGEIDAPHRAGVVGALLGALAAGAGRLDQPVHLFGLNHLPPDLLAALGALSTRAEVHLYFADPSASYWHDLYSERALARAQARGRGEHAEVGHPLLAALARHGQVFNRMLDRLEPVDDQRDPADDDDQDDRSDSLLGRLQDSIRQLDEARLAGPASAGDPSLRVHACHTRLRELEVLRDALLDRLAAMPALRPADIIVMAPDIGAFAALIPAVFGPAGRQLPGERGHIPYRIADRALTAQHPLIACVGQLLGLPEQRMQAAELRALLAVPAIGRRLGLGAAALDVLDRWLARSRVQWGLDGNMKAEFSGVPRDEHSWRWALDRMLLGLMVGTDPAFDGFDGLQPVAPAVGPDADLLGRLRQWLRRLAEGRATMRRRMPLSGWCDWLLGWLDGLLQADHDDPAERAALATLRERIGDLPKAAVTAGCDPELAWPAVREALRDVLDGSPSQPRFVEGGVTFCGMVPARVIPFRVVCILGLDEGAFPRQPPPSQLNLIAAAPRDGDRDPVDEDRYLFLECLMSARDALHLSYCGEGADDGRARNPAAPLAELLGFLQRRLGGEAAHGTPAEDPPWLLRHALQPFDPRYFGGRGNDPRWFSFAAGYRGIGDGAVSGSRRHGGLLGAGRVLEPAGTADDPAEPPTPLPLAELQRFLRSPLRHYCERRLKLRLDVLDDDEGDAEERFEPRTERLDRIEQQLLERALWQDQPIDPASLPAWLRGAGLLPLGEPGETAYRRAARLARAAELATRARFGAALAGRRRQPLQVRLDGADVLLGSLQPLLRIDGRWCLPRWQFGKPLGDQQRLSALLDWAALCLASADDDAAPQLLVLQVEERGGRLRCDWDAQCERWGSGNRDTAHAHAADVLRTLLGWYRHGSAAPLPWLPLSSWACLADDDERRVRAVRKAWGTPAARGERDYVPPYARFVLGEQGPFDAAGGLDPAFVTLAERAAALLAMADADGAAP